MTLYIKDTFKEKFSKLTTWQKYYNCIKHFRRKAIRINTLKISVNKCKQLLEEDFYLTSIPWCKEAFYIEGERRDIGNLEEHKKGYFFVQRPTSLIPSLVLDPKPTDTVLDMCAAPGGKTTHLAQLMNNKGAIIANEFFFNRVKELTINLQRCGVINTVVTQQDGKTLPPLGYDKILLDAPGVQEDVFVKTFTFWKLRSTGRDPVEINIRVW